MPFSDYYGSITCIKENHEKAKKILFWLQYKNPNKKYIMNDVIEELLKIFNEKHKLW